MVRVCSIVFVSLFTINAWSMAEKPKDFSSVRYDNPATEHFCHLDQTVGAQLRITKPEWRLAVSNEGGTLGIGNCWWHSVLQRNAFYRVVMRPDLPRSKDPRALLRRLGSQDGGIVEIPGYENFYQFTRDNYEETLRVIDDMHVWMNGIAEAFRLPPIGAPNSKSHARSVVAQVKKLIDQGALALVSSSDNSGMFYHAFILSKYETITERGQQTTVLAGIESNSPGSPVNAQVYFNELEGLTYLGAGMRHRMAIQPMRNSDFDRFIRARNRYCTR